MTRRQAWLLAGIIGAAAAIRLATLDHQSYDHDEAVTALRVLRGDFGSMLDVVATTERSPPLYYLAAWAWSKGFGTGEVGLRSLSALIGCLTVPGAYLAARELSGPRAGLAASALVAFNPYLAWYSQEARSYALLVLFVTWGLYFFARCLDHPSPRNLAWWATASGLALCSHYFAAFTVGAQGVWLISRSRTRGAPLVAVGATLAVGAALIPLAVAQEGTGRRNLFTGVSLARRALDALFGFFANPEPGAVAGAPSVRHLRDLAVLGGLAVVTIAVVTLLRSGSRRERLGALAIAAVGTAALATPFLLAAIGIDFVDPRNLIASLPALLIAAGIGLGCRRAGRLGTIAATGAVLVFSGVLAAAYESSQMQRPDWRGAAAAIGPPSGPRALVVARNGNEPIAFYLGAHQFRPPLGDQPASEIDVLSVRPWVTPPGRGFRLVERRRMAPCCTLRRYRARRPRIIRPRELAGRRVLHEPSKVLVEEAPRTTGNEGGGRARPGHRNAN
jgi:mannosyltransferase